jgi:hypothetical protein
VTCACLFPCLLIRFCLSFVLLVNPRPLFLLCSCWFIVCSVGCWWLVAQGPSSPVVALLCGLFSIFLCCFSCFWHCSKLVPGVAGRWYQLTPCSDLLHRCLVFGSGMLGYCCLCVIPGTTCAGTYWPLYVVLSLSLFV